MVYTPSDVDERAYQWYAQRQLRKKYRKARIQYQLAQLVEKKSKSLVVNFRLFVQSLRDRFK